MGVWHLSGLGVSPGAVTVPLTYIYLLLKMASGGNEDARDFLAASGEMGQESTGAPEALILFTSADVVQGKEQAREVRDRWFNTHKQKSAPGTIKGYLSCLLNSLKDESFQRFYGSEWLKYFFVIEVDHQDFEDCFFKVAITVNALRDKEVWVNMVGGTNQINAALLAASGFATTAARYYYLFQTDTRLLHLDMDRPDLKIPQLPIPINSWQELPFFTIDMSRLYEELKELFENREKVHVNQIRCILKKLDLPGQSLAKMRSGLINIQNDVVTKGPMLDRWIEMWSRIEKELSGELNMSTWKKWAKGRGILTEMMTF